MKILLTNFSVAERTGTETYLRDVCLALHEAGQDLQLFTSNRGPLAEEFESHGIPVSTALSRLEKPDVIHAQHTWETIAIAAHFPDVPIIYVGHDATALIDRPPNLPSIARYVAVDDEVRDRFVNRSGIAPETVEIIPNLIDFSSFAERLDLPEKPRRIALWSNYCGPREAAEANAAAKAVGCRFEALGRRFGNVTDRPWEIPQQFDLVIAKGRCALECAACGVPVIFADTPGCGGLLTAARLRDNQNRLGGRNWILGPFERLILQKHMESYDPEDARIVAQIIRKTYGRENVLGRLLGLYRSIIGHPSVNVGLADFASEMAWWAKHWTAELRQANQALLELEPTAMVGVDQPVPGCVLRFEGPFRGGGWHEIEFSPNGNYCWMGPEHIAWLELTVPAGRRLELYAEMVDSVDPALPKALSMRINGKSISLKMRKTAYGIEFTGRFSQSRAPKEAATSLVFLDIPFTKSPKELGVSEDQRRLGLAFREIGLRSIR